MRVAAVVAARNEAGRVGATVEAIRSIPGVDEVVVADGSSEDGTADEALAAGARVLVGPARDGKGGALEAAVGWIEPADVYLLLDADLGLTAREGGALLDEVRSGAADLAIGLLPREPRHGGFRLVKWAGAGPPPGRAPAGARMSAGPAWVAGAVALLAAVLLAPAALRLGPQRLRVENWAGRTVPATLGWALLAGGTIGTWTAVLAGATGVVPPRAADHRGAEAGGGDRSGDRTGRLAGGRRRAGGRGVRGDRPLDQPVERAGRRP